MKNWNHWIFPWPHHNPTIYWAITRPSFNNPYMNQSNEGTPPPPTDYLQDTISKSQPPRWSLLHCVNLHLLRHLRNEGKEIRKKKGGWFFFPVGVMWVVFCFRNLCGRDTLLEKDDLEFRNQQGHFKNLVKALETESYMKNVLIYCCHSIPQTTSNLFPACFCNAFQRPDFFCL